MEVTVPYIQKKFAEFNRQMFGGKLPMLPIRLSNAKTFMGQCSFKKRRNKFGKMEHYDFVLRINTRIELPEKELEDIIIHEMIHYYIGYRQLEDTSAHGQLFRTMMTDINRKFGRNISVSHRMTKEQTEQARSARQTWHVVALVKFHDGRSGVKVLPRIVERIAHYYHSVLAAKTIKSVDLFMSCDVFFNRFPCSSALNVCFHDEAEVLEHLKNAKRVECDGENVRIID